MNRLRRIIERFCMWAMGMADAVMFEPDYEPESVEEFADRELGQFKYPDRDMRLRPGRLRAVK